MKDRKPQYLYVVACEGYVKVGRTNNIRSRLVDFSVGNPFQIRLLAAYGFNGRYGATRTEEECHLRLYEAGHHWCGEWFNYHPGWTERIVESCVFEHYEDAFLIRDIEFSSNMKRMNQALRKSVRLSKKRPIRD